MTLQEMILTLVDKGHTKTYAETMAPLDFQELNDPTQIQVMYGGREDCSICRRQMSRIQMKYHYHPCE